LVEVLVVLVEIENGKYFMEDEEFGFARDYYLERSVRLH
jgi:hypothetical protein